MKLSASQKRVLFHCNTSFVPLRGHQFKTIQSLHKRGLVTYEALLECRTCGSVGCRHKGDTRWQIHVRPTEDGKKLCDELRKR
jgi:hypothetical protein